MYDNINLWFAKDINNNIITIDEINLNNKDKYYCPMCGSDLIPKAIESKLVTAHFAHIDASKCNGESMIHFWFKNKFLEPGDIFTIVSDEEKQYICKEVLVEQSYIVGDKIYKPDVTVLTECGNIIYFEIDYSNKKKVLDYIDIWFELKNIVVEVDIKKLMSRDKIPTFKALFYNCKCFNVKKNDMYYNTIGKYKEEVIGNVDKVDNNLKERIKKLDWFWNDILKYKQNEVDIDYMVELINYIDIEDRSLIFDILSKLNCNDIIKKYKSYLFEERRKENNTFAEKLFNNTLLFYNDYDFDISLENNKIIINNLFKTRDIIIIINIDNIEFIKQYYDEVKNKYWAGHKYKTYYKKELVKNTFASYNIRFSDVDGATKYIKEEIDKQIEKSKKYIK